MPALCSVGEPHTARGCVISQLSLHDATVQALLDNLIERGLDPGGCRLFIVYGAKALTKAIRRTFGADIPIHRCQVHTARNITDRLDPNPTALFAAPCARAWEINECGDLCSATSLVGLRDIAGGWR